jgi:glucose/arabinose dehydrogenase
MLFLTTVRLFAAESSVPAAKNMDLDPSAQSEKDWVDNRWARTDVGQFLASNLEIPGGRVAKGLSIKIGANDEGGVGFDTAACAFRAAWTGGFLVPDSARFGLLRAPKIQGPVLLKYAAGPGWIGSDVRYGGLHLHGKRVLLEYLVDGVRVIESPWLETRDKLSVFVRSIEIEPSKTPMKLAVVSGGKGVSITPAGGKTRVLTETSSGPVSLWVLGTNAEFGVSSGTLVISIPPHDQTLPLKLFLWSGDSSSLGAATDLVASLNGPDDLRALLNPGPARWLPELETVGQRGVDTDFFAVDTLTVPYENPWKALMFLAGVDFTPDGAAYVCSIHGDVWRVTGIDDKLGRLRWKRYATGIFQALGLKVRDGKVFVLGRDQITRLHDLDGDGEADFYENFCNAIDTSTSGHDYVTSLEKDDSGNFYFVDPRGAHRVSVDGKKFETLATGFRNPNGLGVSADGRIVTVAPQQGEWTPSSEICEIRDAGYYGYGGPKTGVDRPLGFNVPLCWIPHGVDNSSGSQIWIPENHWGPLGGHFIHLLWGRCGSMFVLRDVVDGVAQGAVAPLPGRFLSGPNRGTFNPRDGNLYVVGSTGWQTSALKDGSLQRVRLSGKPILLPVAWHAWSNGLSLTFSTPLERESAADAGSYGLREWNYHYAAQYGSKDWSVKDPQKEGRDVVEIKSARLSDDEKTVFLEIEGLRPVMQMELKYNLSAKSGKPMRNQLWLTLNRLDAARR